MSKLPKKIFVVDSDFSIMQRLKQALGKYGVAVEGAQDLEAANNGFIQSNQEVIVVDQAFRDVSGLVLIQKWRESDDPNRRATAYVLLCQDKLSKSDQSLIIELLDVLTLNKPINPVASLSIFAKAGTLFQRQMRFEQIRAAILEKTPPEGVDAAVEDLRGKIKDLGPSGPTLIFDLLEKHEQWDKALVYVDAFLSKDPQNIRYLYAKARFLQKLGRAEEALTLMEPLSENSPNNLKRLKELGALYLDLKMPEKAAETAKKVIAYSTIDQDQKYNMFSELMKRGHEQVATQFGQGTMDPLEVVRYYNNLGIKLSKENKVQEAIKEYRAALQLFPTFHENYKLYFNLALCLVKIKEFSYYLAAEKALEQCLELSPEFEKAQSTLERVKTSLKKLTKQAS